MKNSLGKECAGAAREFESFEQTKNNENGLNENVFNENAELLDNNVLCGSALNREKALKTAANVLSYMNRSSVELYERLLEKEISPEDARYAVDKLTTLGYLDDLAFAKSLCARLYSKGYGEARVKTQLRKHKLCGEIIEQTLSENEPDEQSLDGFVEKKLRNADLSDRKALRRVSDALFRRGHGFDEINAAIGRFLEKRREEE